MDPSYYIWLSIVAAAVLWFGLCFKKIFEKISWKFLVCILVFSIISDIIGTTLWLKANNYDYGLETNPVARLMLYSINLPNVIVLSIYSIIMACFLLFLCRLLWKANSKFITRVVLLSMSGLHIIASIRAFIFLYQI